jgi:putative ABC transport system permease protein
MLLRETILQGWHSLMRNRLRSALTMLGIIWGLASVVILLAYGRGLGDSVINAMLGIGNNVVHFWGGQTSMQAGGQRAGKRIRFKFEDVQAIRDEVPLVKNASAEYDDNFGFKYNNRVVSVMVKAVEFPYGEMRKLDVEHGRYFQESDFIEQRRVVIFGPDAAKKVFGNRIPVGEFVSINGSQFEVIGMLRLKIQDSSNNCQDNDCAFVPYVTLRGLMSIRDPDMILIQPVDEAVHLRAIAATRAVLARRHHFHPNDEKATPVWNTVENNIEMRQFAIALEVLMGLIGAMTLGVGGVGVMNIMLVSVTERTREIGLRKAIGARPRHILLQFLIESLVLTFAGGVIGMLLAIALTHIIPPMPLYSEFYKTANNEGDIILRASASVMAISFVILSLVGVVSGFWPALKAARLDPIEALRYE